MSDWKWIKRQIKIELDKPQSSIYEKILSIRTLLNLYEKISSIDNKKQNNYN